MGDVDPRMPDGFDLGLRDGAEPPFSGHILGHGAGIGEHMPESMRVPPSDDSADAWAIGPDGERMWGRYGAAGLLALDRGRGVLLQHRARWSHFGNTWGIPGGALEAGESALDAAFREADEEASVPRDALAPLFTRVVDLGFWSYTTVAAETLREVRAAPRDEESAGVAWVVPREIARLRLHPHFEAAWPALEELLLARPTIVVDAANLVGSVPNGWWRDRASAAVSLVESLARVARKGLPGSVVGMDAARAWPRIVVVLEGKARDAELDIDADGAGATSPGLLRVVRAAGHGDDAIAAEAARAVEEARGQGAGSVVRVVTADKELRRRVSEAGAQTMTSRAFRDTVPLEPDEG